MRHLMPSAATIRHTLQLHIHQQTPRHVTFVFAFAFASSFKSRERTTQKHRIPERNKREIQVTGR